MQLNPKSREISFAHNVFLSFPIALIYCAEHDSITAILCAQFENDSTIETDVTDKRVFVKFEFEKSFDGYRILNKAPNTGWS